MSIATAIIPARGGSKRLPRKNVLELAGKPILSWPIQAALDSELFREVIVSTEDPEIAATALQAGAEVFRRPADLADDVSTVAEVCLNVLEQLEDEDRPVDSFCCIYATAAFLRPGDICMAQNLLKKEPLPDIVMGVSEYNYHPFLAVNENEHGFLERTFPKYKGIKSNSFPKTLCSNGTLYWAQTEAFKRNKTFYSEKIRGFIMPPLRAVDLDTPEDLSLARLLSQVL